MRAANKLVAMMEKHSANLVKQASLMSNELIRAAILRAELWAEAIEEASRIYFGSNDPLAMIDYLMPLHQDMKLQPETMNEVAFYQGFAADLQEAEEWCLLFLKSKRTVAINQAWDIYFTIYKKLSVKLKEIEWYELKNVAPALLKLRDLDISVPGLFRPQKKLLRIHKFASILPVMSTKQHPRKLAIYGSDGKEYMFLLKGHEDIRQDERALQLFGLVNTLLAIDPKTQKKELSIKRYSIIPLSFNSGLIGWVYNTDTLHTLIKEHRKNANIIPNIEYKLMENMCEHFEICPLPNKVEILRFALDRTLGEDLQKVLWLKSENSETWLERRTNYTRSLAVMSMVGYILGLGDRHPSNIMLDRYSGKIIHIDFGDCFEVAMKREKFPEKIPFRLTRMLVKAMEVSGIEGNFRITCEHTMRVLRENRDSLIAILEAFVYDPLVSFKLLKPNLPKDKMDTKNQKEHAKEKPPGSVIQAISMSQQNRLSRGADSKLKGPLVEKISEAMLEKYKQAMPEETPSQPLASHLDLEDAPKEELNQIAEQVITRIQQKLKGSDFGEQILDVETQVDLLIKQATSHENLAQCYIGWCPYW